MNPERIVLFKAFAKTTTVAEQIEITVTRHVNSYYVGVQDLSTIHISLRPEFPILTEIELKSFISGNEILRNKKLAWLWRQETLWAEEFKEKVHSGRITTMTKAKDQASNYFSHYCETYKEARATKQNGGNLKRTRKADETEKEYRTKLAAKEILNPAKLFSFREKVLQILNLEEDALDVQHEAEKNNIKNIYPGEESNCNSSKRADLVGLLASRLC